jgi:RNA polymerase sigma-70 factor (ECF subfamily)
MSSAEQHLPRLRALAYRMLGVHADAEDIVQDVWSRWLALPRADVESPLGWLITATTRACIDRLRQLRREREAYVGPWLPEPEIADADPERSLEIADELSIAFLLMLERLSPEERAAFLLHAAFDQGHAQIAAVLGKSEASVRQLVHRAKSHIESERPRPNVDRARARVVVQHFLEAWQNRDRARLLDLLRADVTYTSDGGGRVAAATRVVVGAERVSRFLVGISTKLPTDEQRVPRIVAGAPGYIRVRQGQIVAAVAVETDQDRIAAMYTVLNPDKLRFYRV